MRPRSITGPLIVIFIGLLFLINNVYPEFFSLARIGDYWPFLLIGAGLIGLVEVLYHARRAYFTGPGFSGFSFSAFSSPASAVITTGVSAASIRQASVFSAPTMITTSTSPNLPGA